MASLDSVTGTTLITFDLHTDCSLGYGGHLYHCLHYAPIYQNHLLWATFNSLIYPLRFYLNCQVLLDTLTADVKSSDLWLLRATEKQIVTFNDRTFLNRFFVSPANFKSTVRRLLVEDYLMVLALSIIISIAVVLHAHLADIYLTAKLKSNPGELPHLAPQELARHLTAAWRAVGVAVVLSTLGIYTVKMNFMLFFYRLGHLITAYATAGCRNGHHRPRCSTVQRYSIRLSVWGHGHHECGRISGVPLGLGLTHLQLLELVTTTIALFKGLY